jgi:hypothetical protein
MFGQEAEQDTVVDRDGWLGSRLIAWYAARQLMQRLIKE